MDNSFPYSTDAPGLQKNFHPFLMRRCESPSRNYNNHNDCIDLEFATYTDSEMASMQSELNMNTPIFPTSIFAPAAYGMNYQLTSPSLKGYSDF